MSKLANYQFVGNSASLAKIDGKNFTITHIEDSDYTQGDEVTPGVKITTKEAFTIENDTNMCNFHTTRVAVVRALSNEKIREDVNLKHEPLGPVKCVKETAKNGKQFFNLVDA